MRRLFGSMLVLVVLAALATGCGSTGDPSTGDDALIFQFISFDNTGLTQADGVSANSAAVDVEQDCCLSSGTGGTSQMVTLEPYTQTIIDAVFQNREINDITLNQYQVDVEDPHIGLPSNVPHNLGATIPGGRCSSAPDRACAVDDNCAIAGVVGTCAFAETTISSLLLFDFDSKERVLAQLDAVGGRALPVTVTFFGTDISGNSFRAVGRYTVTFSNLNNCITGDTPVTCGTL